MRKAQTIYVCNECGSESQKWLGQCPVCGAWNSFFEQKLSCEPVNDGRRRGGEKRPVPEKLSELKASTAGRIDTHMKELNRVLGGGLLPGSLTLITGEPGIGKSTLIIQAAGNIAKNGAVLYVSGEESEAQIKLRAERVCRNTEGIFVLSETDLGSMLNAAADMKPQLLIIDSIQTMYSAELDSAPGSSSQLRQIANLLMNFAKTTGIPVFMVAHVTKSGELAGPKLVEHIVDTVLEFTGERTGDLRILRALKTASAPARK